MRFVRWGREGGIKKSKTKTTKEEEIYIEREARVRKLTKVSAILRDCRSYISMHASK